MIPTRPQGINTNGRVDQLEDRYLGMVEAPSSNLGTSTQLPVYRRLITKIKPHLEPLEV